MRIRNFRTFDPSRRPASPAPGELVDPSSVAAAMEKAVQGHHDLLVALQRRLTEIGIPAGDIEEEPSGVDLLARNMIFEAKTTTDRNHHDQVRYGLAQLLDYDLTSNEFTSLCLVLDRRLNGRQKRLLESVKINALAFVEGQWSMEAGDASLIKKIAGVPYESAASRLARRRKKEVSVSPKSIQEKPVVIEPLGGITVIETDLSSGFVWEITFILMRAWLARLAEGAEIIAFSGESVPHHRGLSTWLAFSDDVPMEFVELVASTLRSCDGHVEMERSSLEHELKFRLS